MNFGEVRIGEDVTDFSDTLGYFDSDGDRYAQPELRLIAGGVYAFKKHRIEAHFKTAGSGLTILTDAALTYSLDFRDDGVVYLNYRHWVEDSYWGPRVEIGTEPAGTYGADEPVHLVWILDADTLSTSVTINGVTHTRSGLAQVFPGLRNGVGYPGPGSIRLSSGQGGSVALRSLKVTGDLWAGPMWLTGDERWGVETDVVEVPVSVPATGTWQPEFCINGVDWVPFGAPITQQDSVTGFAFGTLVARSACARLQSVTD